MSKKSIRAELKKSGDELKKKYPKVYKKLICPLCGMEVPKGTILAHKEHLHGEKMVTPSPSRGVSKAGWVSIVQGGLPSLGRKSK
jgi:hypothetical protein